MDRKRLGDWGEMLAAQYLQAAGYTILAKKYKVKVGEIDLIAEDGNTLIFVEVKTRSSQNFGTAGQAVNFCKQRKIRQTAQWYLAATRQDQKVCRFDVIEVYAEPCGQQVNWIKNAFE